MFPMLKERQDTTGFKEMTEELVNIEMAAHGVTIVEIMRDGLEWHVVGDSPYNRRISPLTPMSQMDQRQAMSGSRRRAIHQGYRSSARSTIAPAARRRGAPISRQRRTSTAISGPTSTTPSASRKKSWRRSGRELPALWGAGVVAGLGQISRPLQRGQGAKRAEPVRLDRRDRSCGCELGPVKHTALGQFAMRAPRPCSTVTAGWSSIAATKRGEYVYRFVTGERYDPTTARRTWRSCRRARFMRRDSMPTEPAGGCRSNSDALPHAGVRLHLAG